jgi:hypothetical protein
MIKGLFVVLFLLIASLAAQAEVSSVMFAAKIKSFDKNEAVVEIAEGKSLKVPRNKIDRASIQTGDAVMITLNGPQEVQAKK